jgi:hypothetical protein
LLDIINPERGESAEKSEVIEVKSAKVHACPQAEMTERHHTHHTYTAPAQPVIARPPQADVPISTKLRPSPLVGEGKGEGLIAR